MASTLGAGDDCGRRFEYHLPVARVAALYRYPVKGLTPEVCEVLSIGADGRVLGVRFADTEAPDEEWTPKAGMLILMNTPGLAHLQVQFDDTAGRLRIGLPGGAVVDEALDDDGRERIAAALAAYAASLPENPLRDHPERRPLRIVGDGRTPRYHDARAGEVTLHSRESLAALADVLGDTDLSELRFRSNVAVEGLEPWEELDWVERGVRIGGVRFEVSRGKGRCLATHANPRTGERDHQIMTTLTHAFGQKRPPAVLGDPVVLMLGQDADPDPSPASVRIWVQSPRLCPVRGLARPPGSRRLGSVVPTGQPVLERSSAAARHPRTRLLSCCSPWLSRSVGHPCRRPTAHDHGFQHRCADRVRDRHAELLDRHPPDPCVRSLPPHPALSGHHSALSGSTRPLPRPGASDDHPERLVLRQPRPIDSREDGGGPGQ